MLESQPLRSPGVRLGFLMIAGVLLVDVVLLYFCLTLPFSLLSFILGLLLLLSLPVLATLFVGTRAIQRGRYHVDADLLHLDLGQAVEQIPLSAIEDIRYGHELTAKTTFRGLRWPGLYLGQGQTTLDGHERAIHYLATRPPADQLLILTTDTIYGSGTSKRGSTSATSRIWLRSGSYPYLARHSKRCVAIPMAFRGIERREASPATSTSS